MGGASAHQARVLAQRQPWMSRLQRFTGNRVGDMEVRVYIASCAAEASGLAESASRRACGRKAFMESDRDDSGERQYEILDSSWLRIGLHASSVGKGPTRRGQVILPICTR